MTVGQEGGSIKCSGKYIEIYFSFKITFPIILLPDKYIEIYFSFKITFPIIRLPEHLISTISIIDPDGGMCNSKE